MNLNFFITNSLLNKLNEANNTPLTLDITKNMEKAPYLGSRFGQDVEPKGTYVTNHTVNAPNYKNGKAYLAKPLFINVNSDTLIEYKRDLAKKYKAKGQALTNKLMAEGYDALITVYDNGEYGEIVLFPNANFSLS